MQQEINNKKTEFDRIVEGDEKTKKQVFFYLENNDNFIIKDFFFFKSSSILMETQQNHQSQQPTTHNYLCIYNERQIKIYHIIQDEYNNACLNLISETSLEQQIITVQGLSIKEKHYLVVLFTDSKLSILQAERETVSLSTVCMFDLDTETLESMTQHQVSFNISDSMLQVDQYSNSIFLILYQRYLIIIPSLSTYTSLKTLLRKQGNLINIDTQNSHQTIPLFGPTVMLNLTYLQVRQIVNYQVQWTQGGLQLYILEKKYSQVKDDYQCQLMKVNLHVLFKEGLDFKKEIEKTVSQQSFQQIVRISDVFLLYKNLCPSTQMIGQEQNGVTLVDAFQLQLFRQEQIIKHRFIKSSSYILQWQGMYLFKQDNNYVQIAWRGDRWQEETILVLGEPSYLNKGSKSIYLDNTSSSLVFNLQGVLFTCNPYTGQQQRKMVKIQGQAQGEGQREGQGEGEGEGENNTDNQYIQTFQQQLQILEQLDNVCVYRSIDNCHNLIGYRNSKESAQIFKITNMVELCQVETESVLSIGEKVLDGWLIGHPQILVVTGQNRTRLYDLDHESRLVEHTAFRQNINTVMLLTTQTYTFQVLYNSILVMDNQYQSIQNIQMEQLQPAIVKCLYYLDRLFVLDDQGYVYLYVMDNTSQQFTRNATLNLLIDLSQDLIITCLSTFKAGLQQLLVVALSDGQILFVNESNAILFRAYNCNQRLPFISADNQHQKDFLKSYTDPNYKLKCSSKQQQIVILNISIKTLNQRLIMIIELSNDTLLIYHQNAQFIDYHFKLFPQKIQYFSQNDYQYDPCLTQKDIAQQILKKYQYKKLVIRMKTQQFQTLYINYQKKPFFIFHQKGEIFMHQNYIKQNSQSIFLKYKQVNDPNNTQCLIIQQKDNKEQKVTILKQQFNPSHLLYNYYTNLIHLKFDFPYRITKLVDMTFQNKSYIILTYKKQCDIQICLFSLEEFKVECSFDLQNVQFITAFEVIQNPKCFYIVLSIVQLQQDCQPINRIFLIELLPTGDKLSLEYKLEVQQSDEIVSQLIYFNNLLYVVCDNKIIIYEIESFKQILVKKHYKTLLTSWSSQGQLLQLGDIRRGFLMMCLTQSQESGIDLKYFNEEGNNIPVKSNCLYTSMDMIHSLISDAHGNLIVYDVDSELTRVADININQSIQRMSSYVDHQQKTILLLFSSLGRQSSFLSLNNYTNNNQFDFQLLLKLQSKLASELPSAAATNPKLFMAYSNKYAHQIHKNNKQILDSRLLQRFNNISFVLQNKLAQSLGLSIQILIMHLKQILN